MWTGPGGTGGDLILEGFLHLGAKSQQKLQPPQSGIRRGFLSKRGFKMLVWSLESSRVTPTRLRRVSHPVEAAGATCAGAP